MGIQKVRSEAHLRVLLFLLGLLSLGLPGHCFADGSWIVLPSDQEISEAASEYAIANTQRMSLPVMPGTDKAEADRNYADTSYTMISVSKFHNTNIGQPVQASEAFALFKVSTKEVRGDDAHESISWVVARLSFGQNGGKAANRFFFTEGIVLKISAEPPLEQEISDWSTAFLRGKYRGYLEYDVTDLWLPGFSGAAPELLSKPLCQEAIDRFQNDKWYTPKDTHIRKDLNELKADLKSGVDCYQRRNPSSEAYASLPVENSNLEVGIWLFGYGGGGKRQIVDRFSFTDRKLTTDILVAQKKGTLLDGSFKAPPRSEAALLQEIVKAYQDPAFKNQKPLSPGDLLCLALEQTGGDLRFATLLAHNTLRAVGRGGQGDSAACGIEGSPEFVSKYLETIRGGPVPGIDPTTDSLASDNSGVWYHMFGTAFFELQTKGDLGVSNLQFMWNPPPDDFLELMREGAKIDTADRTRWSRFANEMEQIYRKYFDAQPEDPEKYCFNLWGAQIASMLFQDLAGRKQLRLAGPGPNDPIPQDGPNGGRIKISLDDLNQAEKLKHLNIDSPFKKPGQRKVNGVFSPVNLIFEKDGKKVELNQSSGSLVGTLPITISPFLEESGNWGVVWLDPPDGAYRVSIEGVGPGILHVFHLDLSNGNFDAFVDPTEQGKKWLLSSSPETGVPLLKRSDGTELRSVTNRSEQVTESKPVENIPVEIQPTSGLSDSGLTGNSIAPPAAATVLLSDSFDDESKKRLYDPEPNQPAFGSRGYRKGEYFIKNDQPQNGAAAVPVPIGETYQDAVLKVDARIVGNSSEKFIALTCRFSAMEYGMYRLAVIPDEQTVILTRFDGPKESILAKERNITIKTGNEWNRLELSCRGDTLTVQINGTLIASAKDTTYSSGGFSIGVGSKNKDQTSEAAFDNLAIDEEASN